MSVGIPSANPAYSLQSVLSAQIALFTAIDQESSGSKLTPSGSGSSAALAIYNNLSSQAQAADTANQNISDASNAINVAQGAASTIQSSLSQLNSLAIEANNGFNSASDQQALQDAATQLAQGINQIAGQTNFNGTPLLDGTTSGNTPATPATADVTNNNAVAAGGDVLASASASGATTSGTFSVQVTGSGNASVSYTDSTTQATTVVGTFAAGSSTTFDGTTLNFGNFTAQDSGTSATVQTTAASAGSTAPTVSVQSGTNEGNTTNVSFVNATTTGLGITNIDLSNPASATNTEGQISGAINAITSNEATLGAQSNGLNFAFENNNTLSNHLTSSASSVGDTSVASAVIAGNTASIQQQISIAVLARANTDAGHLNSFLSQYA
jgi:flagellin